MEIYNIINKIQNKTLLKDYKPIPNQTYRLKSNLMQLCEHDEGIEADMLCNIISINFYEKYEFADSYEITLNMSKFKDHNKLLEKPIFIDNKKWSDLINPYSSNYFSHIFFSDSIDTKIYFEDFFEPIHPIILSLKEIYYSIKDKNMSYEDFQYYIINKKYTII